MAVHSVRNPSTLPTTNVSSSPKHTRTAVVSRAEPCRSSSARGWKLRDTGGAGGGGRGSAEAVWPFVDCVESGGRQRRGGAVRRRRGVRMYLPVHDLAGVGTRDGVLCDVCWWMLLLLVALSFVCAVACCFGAVVLLDDDGVSCCGVAGCRRAAALAVRGGRVV